MRSARAVQLERAVAERDLELAADLGVERVELRRAAPASQPANQRAMRRKRGHQNARASGKSSSGAKCSLAELDQLADRIGGQLCRVNVSVNSPMAPWITVPRSRAPGGVSIASSGASSSTCLA